MLKIKAGRRKDGRRQRANAPGEYSSRTFRSRTRIWVSTVVFSRISAPPPLQQPPQPLANPFRARPRSVSAAIQSSYKEPGRTVRRLSILATSNREREGGCPHPPGPTPSGRPFPAGLSANQFMFLFSRDFLSIVLLRTPVLFLVFIEWFYFRLDCVGDGSVRVILFCRRRNVER